MKNEKDRILFSHDRGEKVYFIDAMVDYGWIDPAAVSLNEQRQLMLTPKGYAHYDELNRGQANSKNPVFVAMWFGGKSRTEEMSRLFKDQIEPAINNAGYKARRADSVEHNESIMDHVHDYIRQAPFVVAELTDNNPGVYYEAGFALGLGTTVIYTCPKEAPRHFDVTAINIVLWDTQEDLCKRLEHRISGTVKQGPFTSEELAGTPG
ncbi:MAG: hypothetical protein IH987_07515 [Planctomycetes bacterium]|nr:hypothetical protein [Planctomycetota bacterium]